MNRQQATELFTLITTVRHVDEMNVTTGVLCGMYSNEPGCLLCEGVRHGLYTEGKGRSIDLGSGFAPHFGCTEEEARHVIYHAINRPVISEPQTTGEIYYKIGKELLIKYGYADLFETAQPIAAQSFAEIMEHLKQAVSVEY